MKPGLTYQSNALKLERIALGTSARPYAITVRVLAVIRGIEEAALDEDLFKDVETVQDFSAMCPVYSTTLQRQTKLLSRPTLTATIQNRFEWGCETGSGHAQKIILYICGDFA